ncbi:MAG: MOSC domain-containing protein [Candidatus Sericytochromatia bacterium]
MSTLAQIWIYPLKSARGLRIDRAELTVMGLAHDRRWMLVDPSGRFISQRECPALARLEVSLERQLGFRWQKRGLELPLPPYDLPEIEVTVWHSQLRAQVFGSGATEWFSQILERPCRLVYMPETTYRRTNPSFAPGKRVSFADGYPFLLCNLASLADLNCRLSEKSLSPVGIERFRPNLVVDHPTAFAEDGWKELRIGAIPFKVVKPCERCVVISTDQLSGQVGKEPLSTLASYRKIAGKVIFGQNLVASVNQGRLQLGDRLELG